MKIRSVMTLVGLAISFGFANIRPTEGHSRSTFDRLVGFLNDIHCGSPCSPASAWIRLVRSNRTQENTTNRRQITLIFLGSRAHGDGRNTATTNLHCVVYCLDTEFRRIVFVS
jgi:hypothetical protein